jgi:hypothetical protein
VGARERVGNEHGVLELAGEEAGERQTGLPLEELRHAGAAAGTALGGGGLRRCELRDDEREETQCAAAARLVVVGEGVAEHADELQQREAARLELCTQLRRQRRRGIVGEKGADRLRRNGRRRERRRWRRLGGHADGCERAQQEEMADGKTARRESKICSAAAARPQHPLRPPRGARGAPDASPSRDPVLPSLPVMITGRCSVPHHHLRPQLSPFPERKLHTASTAALAPYFAADAAQAPTAALLQAVSRAAQV